MKGVGAGAGIGADLLAESVDPAYLNGPNGHCGGWDCEPVDKIHMSVSLSGQFLFILLLAVLCYADFKIVCHKVFFFF